MTNDNNGWYEYKNLVLLEIDRHQGHIESLYRKVVRLEVELEAVKIKAGLVGLVGGILASAGTILLIYLKG